MSLMDSFPPFFELSPPVFSLSSFLFRVFLLTFLDLRGKMGVCSVNSKNQEVFHFLVVVRALIQLGLMLTTGRYDIEQDINMA